MKTESKHGKKFWMNQHGVAIHRELCGNIFERRRKPDDTLSKTRQQIK